MCAHYSQNPLLFLLPIESLSMNSESSVGQQMMLEVLNEVFSTKPHDKDLNNTLRHLAFDEGM